MTDKLPIFPISKIAPCPHCGYQVKTGDKVKVWFCPECEEARAMRCISCNNIMVRKRIKCCHNIDFILKKE